MAEYDGLFYLTEPFEKQPSRRRDPFGFVDIANYYADLLAPGITNRNRDARWLTILCWSLEQVGRDFHDKSTDDFYEYLMGLELRCVIEACRLEDNGRGRHLPGSRAVRQWLRAGRKRSLKAEMGQDQWRRYKYVGPYSCYRRLMQETALLDADGWTLTANGHELAKLLKPDLNENTNKTTDGSWVDYWLRRCPEVERPQSMLLAKPSSSLSLTQRERRLIEPLIFGSDLDDDTCNRRRTIAKTFTKIASRDDDHAEMCRKIQKCLLETSNKWPNEEKLKFLKLGAFAVLADTAVAALKAAYNAVKEPTDVNDVAEETITELKLLKKAVINWEHDGVWTKVDSFADNMRKAKYPVDFLTLLVQLHIERGGELKWLSLKSSNLDRAVRYNKPPYGFYRFRLGTLARLAVGCGVIDALPPVFSGDIDAMEDE